MSRTRLRKLAKPESYVSAKDAAACLRSIADEVEQRDDGQLLSIRIERKYASQKGN